MRKRVNTAECVPPTKKAAGKSGHRKVRPHDEVTTMKSDDELRKMLEQMDCLYTLPVGEAAKRFLEIAGDCTEREIKRIGELAHEKTLTLEKELRQVGEILRRHGYRHAEQGSRRQADEAV